MNYIKLINSFYDRLETNPLSTSAITLWHAYVHINNKAGWINEFTVAISVLRIKSGLSEKSVTNARNELSQKGYIEFRSRKGNQSALYKLVDLSVMITDKLADNVSYKTSDNTTGNTSALIKQNKIKQNETEDDKASNPKTKRGDPNAKYRRNHSQASGESESILNGRIGWIGRSEV